MAQNPDFFRPYNDLVQYIPNQLRNPVNTGLVQNLFNRFMTKDESVPMYGYVGQKPSSTYDKSARIPSLTVERDINAVVPILNFTVGSERVAFTVEDLLNKAKVLGIDTNDLAWLYSQGSNFKPPIDFDKFTNFFDYYWVAKALPTPATPSWNPEALPEYYVQARPAPTDADKLDCRVATTGPIILTGSGFLDRVFTLTFSTNYDFTVTSTDSLGNFFTHPSSAPGGLRSLNNAPTGNTDFTESFTVFDASGTPLVSFSITRSPIFDASSIVTGWSGFEAGDAFHLETSFLSSNYSVTYEIGTGVRGSISAVRTLPGYQVVDGVTLRPGDRILVKNQNGSFPSADNGIFVVSAGAWSLADDFTPGAFSRTFVSDGLSSHDFTFESNTGMLVSWNALPGASVSRVSDWQGGNFWVRGDALGAFDRANVVQAVRPIIEFDADLQLNTHLSVGGVPGDGVSNFHQRKTEFNQLPLFDLFRYDGTHAGLVSSIFYYVEDLGGVLDLPMQKRLKRSTNASSDLVFNHGCADTAGNLLFFKKKNSAGVSSLHTVWHPGYASATIVKNADGLDYTFKGIGNGVMSGVAATEYTQQQSWSIVCTRSDGVLPTLFKVVGSKMPSQPMVATVPNTPGIPTAYNNGEISFTLTAGSEPFVKGDTFTVQVGNLERPRYVFRASDESVQDVPGGAATGGGAYLLPRTFYNNPYNESRAELSEGSLYSHFRSVLGGNATAVDYALGGSIKLWSEQQTLLASMLMQKDFTLTSMLDMAKRQYDTGLNSIRDLFTTHIIEYFSQVGVNSPTVLLDYLLAIRAQDNDVRTVLYDSTSGVVGIPATLPQLGLAELVMPEVYYDLVLGINVLKHHDGHLSEQYVDTVEFRNTILGNYVSKTVLRSDGNSTSAIGSFNDVAPTTLYKGLLWIKNNGSMWAFDVDHDGTEPVGVMGETWYDRVSGNIYTFDGFSWVLGGVGWVQVDLAAMVNSIMLLVEQRLYDKISGEQRRYDFTPLMSNSGFQSELQAELNNFAALNNLDPLGTNYSQVDAFTWNYAGGIPTNFAGMVDVTTLSPLGVVPARWYNVLKAHQASVAGVIPTERPNVEPWKLFGYSTLAQWQAATAPSVFSTYVSVLAEPDLWQYRHVEVVRATGTMTSLSGLSLDDVSLNVGDHVLVGDRVYVVSSGVWLSTRQLAVGEYVTVSEGSKYAGTSWANVGTMAQARYWSDALWAAVATLHPGLKTSVNPWTDELLPPYVSGTKATAPYALTNYIPSGIAMPFSYGEGSPVEEVWTRSIEYGYAKAKALGRLDPLALLGFAWGFNWVEVDGILYDGYDINVPGHKRFKLHGETVTTVDRTNALIASAPFGATTPKTYVITYEAYDAGRSQNFTVRTGGVRAGYITEGATYTIDAITLKIEDFGQPFHMGDSFTVMVDAVGYVTWTFTPATSHLILGLGQTFTNALREISVDTKSSYAINAFRDWEVNMGFRAGSLVSTEDLTIYTESDTLNPSSYDLMLKKNEIARDVWLQALRVTVFQKGACGTVEAGTGTLIKPNSPTGDGSDWVFRVEGYNPRHATLNYHTFQPIASGVTFPLGASVGDTFFRHDLGGYYQVIGNQWILTDTTDLVTFKALTQGNTSLTWFNPTVVTGTATALLPITIVGVQNLINFLAGYASWADAEGWRFSHEGEYLTDQSTGRQRNWQLEIERTVDSIYQGPNIGAGMVVNPFLDRVWIQQDTGLLSEFTDTSLFDITGNPGAFDILGVKYKSSDLRPVRGDQASSIGCTGPMFSVHAQFDEFEHLFIFNNWVDTSTQTGLLYNAFSGARAATYKFIGRRAATKTLRPEFGGHYNVNGVTLRNIQASTDSLSTVYDANNAFENTRSSKHALALLGFSTKDYLSNLDISDKTQFNFWRGLIQTKGTNLSIDAYLNNDRFQDAKIDEYWAYKIAEYGDSRQLAYPELRVEVADCLQQFTLLQFDAAPGTELTNFTQISRLDEARWFSIDDLNQDAFFKAEPVGTFVKTITTLDPVTLPFIADKLVSNIDYILINSTTIKPTILPDGPLTVVGYGPAVPRYNPIKLFNYDAAELVEEIPHWHPAAGQHNPVALECINIIGDIDPARYTYSTLVQGNNNYDPLRPWGDRELGRVWFDTRNLAYVPYYDTTIYANRAERLSRWGSIADYATVDVYEWVKSSVPPAGYAALAKVEALDADITGSSKASGDVALSANYSRDRTWFVRPVAWSGGVGNTLSGGHPAFHYSSPGGSASVVTANGNVLSIDRNNFSDFGVKVGMSIGGWDPTPANPHPISEAVITALTKTIVYDPLFTGTSGNFTVGISSTTYKADATGDFYFAAVPPVSTVLPDGITYQTISALRILNTTTAVEETITLSTLFGLTGAARLDVSAGQVLTYVSKTFGLTISVTCAVADALLPEAVANAIGAVLFTYITVQDAVVIAPVVALPITTLSNDSSGAIGWRAWSIPTQAQLDTDGRAPLSIYKPYLGDAVQFWPSKDELDAARLYLDAPLTLNDGTVVQKYTTGWTDWALLSDTVYDQTVTRPGSVSILHEVDGTVTNIDVTRTTVYINGIAQLKSGYTIVGPTLTITSPSVGAHIHVIIRQYAPSKDELAFNPDVKEDYSFQRHYKTDFEYTTVTTRAEDGSPSVSYYYFWVKNRVVIALNKKLSTQAIAKYLTNGPASYLTFQVGDTGMLGSGSVSDPYGYNAISVSGLSYLVTKDSTFKLRFTRNFTLRDDPQQLELKNTHTEWGLLRPAQKSKIPEVLWNKLVDSMAGKDAAGNTLPAARRSLYDERTGAKTSYGFGPEQILAPVDLLRSSVTHCILNTKLTTTTIDGKVIPNFISVLDFNQSDSWFSTIAAVRATMMTIWTSASTLQVNEIFFAALEDILANNLELTDIFKTSRLSAYSVRSVVAPGAAPIYE